MANEKKSGRSLTVTGQQNMKASTTKVAHSAGVGLGGLLVDADNNQYNFDATAALPAGAFMHSGVAITADGRVCTTTGAVATSAQWRGGIAFRADGAMHVTVAAVSPASSPCGHGRYATGGALHIVAN